MSRRQWLAPMTVLAVALVAGVVTTVLVLSTRRDTGPGREMRPTGKAATETSAPAGEPTGVPYGKTKPAIGECADARPNSRNEAELYRGLRRPEYHRSC